MWLSLVSTVGEKDFLWKYKNGVYRRLRCMGDWGGESCSKISFVFCGTFWSFLDQCVIEISPHFRYRLHDALLIPPKTQKCFLSKAIQFCDVDCWHGSTLDFVLGLYHCKFTQVCGGFHSHFSFDWKKKVRLALALSLPGNLLCLPHEKIWRKLENVQEHFGRYCHSCY